MNFNFELILFYATLITGIIVLFDRVFLAKKRKAKKEGALKLPLIIDYATAFFPVLLIVFVLRSFVFEPFRIPTPSLEPTLLIGDFIIVNKFAYGIRLPVIHKKIVSIHEPARGDIMVFRYPPKPSVDYIKRVIGLPGDKISYVDKTLYVNGVKIPQTFEKYSMEEYESNHVTMAQKSEDLLGVTHQIYQNPDRLSYDYHDIVVPQGMYFVMGDNRDDSADSRYWGFVPDENIIGKATWIWLSWNASGFGLRWHRIGTAIH